MSRTRNSLPLESTFNQVYERIATQPGRRTTLLQTIGGVEFIGEARTTRDGRRVISLPHHNRIYETDWGYTSNNMGKDGQRIAHYSVPLDNGCGDTKYTN